MTDTRKHGLLTPLSIHRIFKWTRKNTTPDLTAPSVLRVNTEMNSYSNFIETRSLELQIPTMI